MLEKYEREIAAEFDASFFVSEAEAAFFRARAGASARRIDYYLNGVDIAYFSPETRLASPYREGARAVVFTGYMDYRPNIDAVKWFVQEVWENIRRACPEAVFFIVGARPPREVQALGDVEGVFVTGAVPDVRPWVSHAWVSVAPMRMARGIQNKVLEAMAMAIPVVVTPAGIEGIELCPETQCRVVAEAGAFADACTGLLSGEVPARDSAARDCIVRHYDWPQVFHRLDACLWPAGPAAAGTGT